MDPTQVSTIEGLDINRLRLATRSRRNSRSLDEVLAAAHAQRRKSSAAAQGLGIDASVAASKRLLAKR
jgi:hypothetical protein